MTSPRLEWTVDQLDVQADDDVLEVGCGHGVAAGLLLARLPSGTYTGLDRSPAMIAASTRRARAAVDAGRATFVEASIVDASLPDEGFDRVFAARVQAMSDTRELERVRRALRRGGVLLLSFDSPGDERTRRLADRTTRNLEASGYEMLPSVEAAFDGGTVVCLRATKK
jgi:ubiquinone/menaquinone biosynthesis C-methylase UbiE